jgi:hypothetical protein
MPDFVYPSWFGGLFASAKDFVELAVLAAVAYAFYRRFVLKPDRLEANREAILILSLIAAIMVTDLLFDGFRFALSAGSDPGIVTSSALPSPARRWQRRSAGFPKARCAQAGIFRTGCRC